MDEATAPLLVPIPNRSCSDERHDPWTCPAFAVGTSSRATLVHDKWIGSTDCIAQGQPFDSRTGRSETQPDRPGPHDLAHPRPFIAREGDPCSDSARFLLRRPPSMPTA